MRDNQKCYVIRKKDIDATLANMPFKGTKLLEPLKSIAAAHGLPFNILEKKNVSNNAEVHKHESDLWLCLEGKVTFIYGGEMVNPWFHKNVDGSLNQNELQAKEIKDGTEVILTRGDWLWIPAGEPHQHRCSGVARLIIIKIPAHRL